MLRISRKFGRNIFFACFASLFLIGFLASGCGGGGASGESLPAKMLTWEAPTAYSDGTPLDPGIELDSFEFYLNEHGSFSEADAKVAAIPATRNGTGQVVTSYNLANLAPYISKGITYFVSVRAVSKGGVKSDFSPSAAFSY